MKLLAILKDSFRETVDSKVFNVLLAMSVAVFLLFASISFTPQPYTGLRFALQESLNRSGPVPTRSALLWMVRGVQFVDGPADQPGTPFVLTISTRHPTAEAAAEAAADLPALRRFFEERLGRLDDWKLLHIADVRRPAPDNAFLQGINERDVVVEVLAQPTAKMRLVWPHRSSLLFGLLPMDQFWALVFERPDPPSLGFQLWYFEDQFLNGPLCWVAVMVSVIITAFFIPNMMQKGRLDLLLVKPMSRIGLLAYKYLGGLLFIALNSAFAVGGVWIVLGLCSGVWDPTVLLTILVIIFFFAILYAVSTLTAVLTRNGVVAIVMTCLVWLLLFAVGRTYTFLYDNAEKLQIRDAKALEVPQWALPAATVLHHALPRTDDLNPLITRLLAGSLMPPDEVRGFDLVSRAVDWRQSIIVSVVFIVVFLGLACWRFSAGDY